MPPVPQLPPRPTPTAAPITFSKIRVPQLQPGDTSQVAAIFAQALRGTGQVLQSIKDADVIVANAYQLELPRHLADVTLEVERTGRPVSDVINERFSDSLEFRQSLKIEIGRQRADLDATTIQQQFQQDPSIPFSDIFRARREDMFHSFEDVDIQQGYDNTIVQREVTIIKTLQQMEFQAAQESKEQRSNTEVRASIADSMDRHFNALPTLEEGDTADPRFILQEAQEAWIRINFPNKTIEELSASQTVGMEADIRQQFLATLASPIISLTLNQRVDLLEDMKFVDLNLNEFQAAELKGAVDTFTIQAIRANNQAMQTRVAEINSVMDNVKELEDFKLLLSLIGPTFSLTEGFENQLGKIPMGGDIFGKTQLSSVDSNLLNGLEKKFMDLQKKFARNLQIEATINPADGSPGASAGLTKSDNPYLEAEFIKLVLPVSQNGNGMSRPEAYAHMLRRFKTPNAITESMVSEINAVWQDNPLEAILILDALREERPDIVNSSVLRDTLESDIRDVFNVIILAQLDSADVLSQISRSRFTDADFAAAKVDIEAKASELSPPDSRFFGADPVRSRDAEDLHESAYRFFRRIGQTDKESEKNADTLYLRNIQTVTFNKRDIVVVPLPVNVQDGQDGSASITNRFGRPVYDELGVMFSLIATLDKWGPTTSINVQDIQLSEDGRNWQFRVIENTGGLQDRSIEILNIPVDDVERIKVLRSLQEVIFQQDISGGGTGVPPDPFSVGNILKRLFVALPTPTFSQAEGIGFQFGGPIEFVRDVLGGEIRKSQQVKSPAFFDRDSEGLSRFR